MLFNQTKNYQLQSRLNSLKIILKKQQQNARNQNHYLSAGFKLFEFLKPERNINKLTEKKLQKSLCLKSSEGQIIMLTKKNKKEDNQGEPNNSIMLETVVAVVI